MATNNAINLKSQGVVYYNGSGTFSAYNPLDVANGGTGATSDTAYAVQCAGTTATGVWQSIAGLGTAGQVLTSNGAAALPTMQTKTSPNIGYVIRLSTIFGNPADLATYYFVDGANLTVNTTATNASSHLVIPKAGTITKVYCTYSVEGTLGSSANSTVAVRLNNTTDTNISTTVNLNATIVNFNSSPSIAVVAGDYVQFKMVCPSWGTNPTNVYFSGTILVT